MKKNLLIVLIFSMGFLMFAGGSASYGDFRSPLFLGGAPLVTGTDSPQLDGLNPAASAGTQRITLDLSYIALALDSTIEGWKGHVINLGATLPTKAGVLSFSSDFVTTPEYETLDYGTQFDLRASFSKELYPGFYTGFGLKGSFGEGWGAAADIGVIHFLGDLGPFRNFRWAAALQELGYQDKSKTTAPLYTLTGGAAFTALKNEDFRWEAGADISAPTFQNVRLTLGTELSFRETLGLRAATRFDLEELLNGEPAGMIPSVSLTYTYKPARLYAETEAAEAPRVWQRGELATTAGAAPLGNGLWAFGLGLNVALGAIDKKPPKIEIDFSGFRYTPKEESSEEETPPEGSGSGTEEEPAGAEEGSSENTSQAPAIQPPGGPKGEDPP